MKSVLRVGLLAVLVFALLGAYRYVSAQEEHSGRSRAPVAPPTFAMHPADLPPAAVKHVLVGTYINQWTGTPVNVPVNTYTPIDPLTTITCPGTSGSCLIVSEQWTEVNPTTNCQGCNGVATCLYVDGVPDSYCGWYDGDMQTAWIDATDFQTTTSHQTTVPHGTHTVQTFVIMINGGTTYYWDYHYLVFKP